MNVRTDGNINLERITKALNQIYSQRYESVVEVELKKSRSTDQSKRDNMNELNNSSKGV